MIWLRRFLTIPLIFIFVASLVMAVVVTAVNNTAANPRFYNDQMKQADVYNYIYTDIIPAAWDEVKTNQASDLPVNISDFKTEITAAAEQVFPPSWIQAQFEAATSTVIPYVVDYQDGFTYTFTVKDRMDDIGQAIKDNLLVGNAFTSLYNDLIAYIAQYYYDNLPELPPGIDITQSEIETALKNIDSLEPWLKAQLDTAIDQVIPYLSGDRDYFEVSIPIQQLVTDETLLELLGPSNEDYLDEARAWLGDGWTYTQNDLYADLSDVNVQYLQDVRGWIHDGYTFDQDNIPEEVMDPGGNFVPFKEPFDDMRYWIDVGRSLLWVLWLVPFIILIGIGFLGGCGWKTRAAGPLVILFVVSLVMFLGVMLTWGQWGETAVRDAINTSGHQGVEAVMLEKADDIAINAAGSFVNDMQDTYMYMMIASGVGLVGVGVWWAISSRGKKSVAPST